MLASEPAVNDVEPSRSLSPAVAGDGSTVRAPESAPARRAGRREWIGLVALALPCLLYSMDLTVLHLAVPKLSADLKPSSAELLWIIDIYGFLVAGSLITMGTLGDRIGRRRLLLIGAAAFGVASVIAAFSAGATMLIVTRALLGLAGATIAPSTLSLIRNMFTDPGQRTTAIGVWVTSFSIGGAIGPLVGGVLLQAFWWGSVFLMSVPVMALLLILGPKLLPEYRDPAAGRLDLLSAALSLAAVLATIYGIKQIAQDGLRSTYLLFIFAGLAIGALFVRRQLRLADPLLDLRLFRSRAFTMSLATYGLSILFLFGSFLFLPQFLQLVLGMSPLRSGLWTLPWTLAFVVGSMLTPVVVKHVRPAHLMAGGLVLAAAGFAMFTRIDASSGFAYFAAGTVFFSLGASPVFTLTTDLIVGSAPPERAGAASAISETSAEFGGAIGIAIFGSIGVAIYRALLGDSLAAGVSADAAETARATLAGALAVANDLPGPAGARLTETARGAFIAGLRLCAGISTAGALGLALLAGIGLRHVRSAGGTPPAGVSTG
jgi:DHA2 family multidrug resistance protein-like MFS transporter